MNYFLVINRSKDSVKQIEVQHKKGNHSIYEIGPGIIKGIEIPDTIDSIRTIEDIPSNNRSFVVRDIITQPDNVTIKTYILPGYTKPPLKADPTTSASEKILNPDRSLIGIELQNAESIFNKIGLF